MGNLTSISITPVQADIIFKALYYTASNEGVSIPNELTEIFEVVAEQNPNDTHVSDTVDVMEFLSGFIENNDPYKEYFERV
ncbi:hypothetical protein NSQ62_08190 [Solibacillus sp. FSL H8-0523]|uniref:hypothetical protein n=1 Tax=Solibacillus sp. FSL H8-0523 TaxID=2954511 RepID=UPI003101A90A